MRAEAVTNLLVAFWTRLTRFGASVGNAFRTVGHRRKWNLSVPAPHR